MRKVLGWIMVAFLMQACITYEDVEINEIKDYKVENLLDTSKDFKLILVVEVDNPNTYNITLKETDLNLFIEKKDLGKVRLESPVKMPKKTVSTQEFVIKPESRSMIISALGGAGNVFKDGKVDIRVKGRVKGKAFGLSKWFDVNHKETIDLKGQLFLMPDID